MLGIALSHNQSIKQHEIFVGRRYTTRPGAPTVVSGKHDSKVHSFSESFSESTGVSNVVEVGRKSVPGGWATVAEKPRLQIWFLFLAQHNPLSQSTSAGICY